MNIYIPYSAARDIHKGLELKYALRSIEKYLTGWEDICIVGDFPEFLKKGIEMIPVVEVRVFEDFSMEFGGDIKISEMKHIVCTDIPGQKETSIYRKMLLAHDENFIMWHDDHFLIKPLDVAYFKQWRNGKLAEEIRRPHGGRYNKALNNTLEKYPNAGYYDVHAPIILNRENLKQLIWDREYCFKTVYCSEFPGTSETIEDLKFDNYVSREYIKNLIKDRLFFSTGAMYDPMIEVLNELFPEKSKFEI